MSDADSFLLEAAYLKKPDKKGKSEICLYYRARNIYGGFSGRGETVLLKNGRFLDVDEKNEANTFFGPVDPCGSSTRIADITADVLSALNPAQPRLEQVRSRADRPKRVWPDMPK